MPRFAANLSMLYAEHPFLDRCAAAAADGFCAVECQFPYAHGRHELVARIADASLRMALINAPPGDAGERGLACLPGRQDAFRRSLLDEALPWAQALGCPRVHVMAGNMPDGIGLERLHDTYLDNLAWAAGPAAQAGITLLIEALNPHDAPGYFLSTQQQAHAVVDAIGSPHVRVQLDLYHCRRSGGDAAAELRAALPSGRVGHLQSAGVPDRHEPDARDDTVLFELIDALGYDGWVGAEYRPRGATSDGLGWFQRWKEGTP